MANPTGPDKVRNAPEGAGGTVRGQVFAAACLAGWTTSGDSLSALYQHPEDGREVRVRYRADGNPERAERNYGRTGMPRKVFGPYCGPQVRGWFKDGTLPDGSEPAETAAKPVIRPAVPNTPDRKLRRLVEELEASARTIQEDVAMFRSVGLKQHFSVAELDELIIRLGRLSADAQHAAGEAKYLLLERHPSGGAELARLVRQQDRGEG